MDEPKPRQPWTPSGWLLHLLTAWHVLFYALLAFTIVLIVLQFFGVIDWLRLAFPNLRQ